MVSKTNSIRIPPEGGTTNLFQQPVREGLSESLDDDVITAATAEHRALVTLDLDFANPLRYVPSRYAGIILFRRRSKPTNEDILTLARTLLGFLRKELPFGKLWIIERGRVRVYEEPSIDE